VLLPLELLPERLVLLHVLVLLPEHLRFRSLLL
jgi:hypothetical protein